MIEQWNGLPGMIVEAPLELGPGPGRARAGGEMSWTGGLIALPGLGLVGTIL